MRPIDAGELKKEVEPEFRGALGITVLTGAEETGLDPGEYAEYLVGKAAECSDRLRHIWG